MPFDRDIAEIAYDVRTGQREFKSVPEAQRKDVARAMARMGAQDYQAVTDRRRTPRGGGSGAHYTSRA